MRSSSVGKPDGSHEFELYVTDVNQIKTNVGLGCLSQNQTVSVSSQTYYRLLDGYVFIGGDSGAPVFDPNENFIGMINGSAAPPYDYLGFGTNAAAIQTTLNFDRWYGTATVQDRTIGVFRPSTRFFFIDKGDDVWVGSGSNADLITSLGAPGDLPLMGDWDGNTTVTIGIYRPSTGFFYLNNTNTPGAVDRIFALGGLSGDLPVAGNWDGIGTETTVGIYRTSNRTFYLSNTWNWGVVDIQVPLGAPGDLPVVGDWDGNGTVTPGVYRASNLTFYLLNGFNPAGPYTIYSLGSPFSSSDVPVVGDWTGTGPTKIGLWRPSNGQWWLDNGSGTDQGCALDRCPSPHGIAGDIPLAGIRSERRAN